jgi:hypothetical protein
MTTNFRSLLAALVAGVALAGAAHAQGAGGKLAALDTNHDGVLSRDEIQAHPHLAQKFDAIDTNRDGGLSRAELMAWHQQHHKGGEGGHGGGLQRLDTNHDGQLERSEVANDPRALARFDAADANHDGVVTREEVRAARAAHHNAAGTPQ